MHLRLWLQPPAAAPPVDALGWSTKSDAELTSNRQCNAHTHTHTHRGEGRHEFDAATNTDKELDAATNTDTARDADTDFDTARDANTDTVIVHMSISSYSHAHHAVTV